MRKWHRWVSIPAILFLSIVAVSGLILQVQGFLNEDEEANRTLADSKSPPTVSQLPSTINLESAQAALIANMGNVHLKKIEIDFRSTPSTLTFFTEEASPKVVQMAAGNYKILWEKESNESDFWIKLHSGEILGDAGRAVGIFGGLALLFLTITGGWIYVQMFNRRQASQSLRKRFFW